MERLSLILICLVILSIQLLLCFKVKKLVFRLIPAGLLTTALAISMYLLLTATGWDALGYIVFVMVFGICHIPCATGWLIWLVVWLIRRKKRIH